MKTVNRRTLHERTGEIVDRAGRGEVILVLRRGVAIAELSPVSARTQSVMPDRDRILAKFPKLGGDSTRFLEEDREP